MAGKGINFLKGILPGSLVPKYFESEWSFAQVSEFDSIVMFVRVLRVCDRHCHATC